MLGVLLALIVCQHPGIAAADTRFAGDDSTRYVLDIEAQPLNDALQDFAQQSGLQIVFLSELTDGLQSPAIKGIHTLQTAMTALLGGDSLTFRVINPQTLQIRQLTAAPPRPPAARPTRVRAARAPRADPMEQVVITGVAEQLVATRIATPLSEIPQTVSIISDEQMRQRNVTDLADALNTAPGVTMFRRDSLDRQVYSRAYQITSFHIDGGAALDPTINLFSVYMGSPDMSEFAHVEVLRGSDALFGGNGDPGGTVSLVRKRPRASRQINLSVLGGSWEKGRVEIDATGPLTTTGNLRGRVDTVYSHQNYFYDTANLRRKRIYGTLDYDLGPATTLAVGGSYQWDDSVPFVDGLPLYADGNDPRLPRDTGLTFEWAYQRVRLNEAFMQLRQELGEDWALKMNAARWGARVDYLKGNFPMPINPITNLLLDPPGGVDTPTPNTVAQITADATVAGVFDLFGMRQELAFGGDFTRLDAHLDLRDVLIDGPKPADLRAYDPRQYSLRPNPGPVLSFDGHSIKKQYGFFASLRLYLDDRFSMNAGGRVGSDSINTRIAVHFGSLSAPADVQWGNTHVFTPYGGLMYDLNEHYSVYASYADIYKTTGLALRRDGRNIGPANGVNIEAGLKGSWRDGALNGSLVLYRIRQSGLPLRDPQRVPPGVSSSYCCFVTGESRSKGADLELNGEVAQGWLIGAGYTWNLNESATGGALSRQTPRHLLKAWTNKRLSASLNRWTIGGSIHAQTPITTIGDYCSMSALSCTAFEVVQHPYAVIGLRAGYELDENWRIALNVDNVLDKNYYETLSEPLHVWYGDPRNFTVRIDGSF